MTPEFIKTILKALAVVAVVGGGFGMSVCILFIAGSSIHWATMASLPFIAGSVLVAGGLVSYSLLFIHEHPKH